MAPVILMMGNRAAADTNEFRNFAGLKMGVALTLTLDTGSHDRIKEAKVVDGIVRVTKDDNTIPRIMLESHYLFTPNNDFCTSLSLFRGVKAGEWGHGPFVAIQPGKDELIEAIGLGWMLALRRDKNTQASWNIAFGIVVDRNQSILGDGVKENRPLPGSETEVRLKETSQTGLLLLTSFSF